MAVSKNRGAYASRRSTKLKRASGRRPVIGFKTLKYAPILLGLVFFLRLITGGTSSLAAQTLPTPWASQDIGSVGLAGSTTAGFSSGSFTIKASGSDIWSTSDSFHFLYQPLNGNGEIIARLASLDNTDVNAKVGVMIRETLSANSKHVILDAVPSGHLEFMSRSSTGGTTSYLTGKTTSFPVFVKLVRSGNTITGYSSDNGAVWTQVGSTSVSMVTNVYIGIGVTSHNNSVLTTANVDSVIVNGVTTSPTPTPTSTPTPSPTPSPTPTASPSPTPTPASGVLPLPWSNRDLGSVGITGSTTAVSVITGSYSIKGSGADIWGTADAFQYLYQPLNGNGQIVARVTGLTSTDANAKVGLMIRETLSANSRHAILDYTPSNKLEFMGRTSTGGNTNYIAGKAVNLPVWLKLVRSGNTLIGYSSVDSINWSQVGSTTVSMSSSVFIGLAVVSHNNSMLATATVDNVTVAPAPPGACGSSARWGIKTGTDADARLVNLSSVTPTTVTTMIQWPIPASLSTTTRISPYETTLWTISGTLVETDLEGDSDYHLMIRDDSGNTMFTEIPHPACVGSNSPFAAAIANARAKFDAQLKVTTTPQQPNIAVRITGVGMFDALPGDPGSAPNGIELHPIVDIDFPNSTPSPTPSPTPTATGSQPFTGTPISVPGIIQAENFDLGGEGVAYHDLNTGNSGGAYRTGEGVDIEAATDTGGGYNVGWTAAGEWLKYTVNVTSSGTYNIQVRVAINGSGGTFHLEFNGVDKTGPIAVPNTGGWQSWATVTKSGVSLSSGQQVMRIVMDSVGVDGAVGNFNYVQIVSASTTSNINFANKPLLAAGVSRSPDSVANSFYSMTRIKLDADGNSYVPTAIGNIYFMPLDESKMREVAQRSLRF